MRPVASRAFGTTALKYTLAAVFMGGALGVLGWRIVSGGSSDAKPARQRAQALTPEGETVETNYTKVRSKDDAREAVSRLGEEVGRGAGEIESVSKLGEAVSTQLAAAASDALGPFLLGSYDEFVEAMRRLGAVIDPDAKHAPLYDQFASWCAMGEPDLTRLEVRPFEPMHPGGDGEAAPRHVARTQARPNDEEKDPGVGVRQMMLTPQGLFPDVGLDTKSSRPPIEVRVPIRPKSGADKGGEITLGVVLVWNDQAQLWQPGAYSQTSYTKGKEP
ncbi:MAG: hypothetical protein R3B57_01435 [Phycisphaerales bacterium]